MHRLIIILLTHPLLSISGPSSSRVLANQMISIEAALNNNDNKKICSAQSVYYLDNNGTYSYCYSDPDRSDKTIHPINIDAVTLYPEKKLVEIVYYLGIENKAKSTSKTASVAFGKSLPLQQSDGTSVILSVSFLSRSNR